MIANDVEIDIDQFGGDFLMTSYPFAMSPCSANVTVSLDGIPDRFTIYLVEGIDPTRSRQPILMADG